jgi:hypothetical protein
LDSIKELGFEPETVTVDTASVAPPELVRVNTCGALEAPGAVLGKLTEVELSVMAGDGGIDTPLSVII